MLPSDRVSELLNVFFYYNYKSAYSMKNVLKTVIKLLRGAENFDQISR